MPSGEPVPAQASAVTKLTSSQLVRNKPNPNPHLTFPQNPLPNSAISAISGQLQSYSDTCEALSIIEVTLGFLSTAGGNPGMDLNVYIQQVLQMCDPTAQVLKVSTSAKPGGIPVLPVLRKKRQGDCNSQANLDYTVSSMPY